MKMQNIERALVAHDLAKAEKRRADIRAKIATQDLIQIALDQGRYDLLQLNATGVRREVNHMEDTAREHYEQDCKAELLRELKQ